jgi:hypothetical protein
MSNLKCKLAKMAAKIPPERIMVVRETKKAEKGKNIAKLWRMIVD